MKILKIIHGYPPKYNAGSEVYSQMLCHGLSKNHKVIVLTREEDPFKLLFSRSIEYDYLNPDIKLYVINIPRENYRYSYRNEEVDQYCQDIILEEKPDIVHIGHLNHLSVSLLEVCKKNNLPIVFTLHDYWLMCPRGQFIKRNSSECWQLCTKQEDTVCATECYGGYFSGALEDKTEDENYWTRWVARRMHYVKLVAQYVDRYIAPSQYLKQRFKDFTIPEKKITYLDYGFEMKRFYSPVKHLNSDNFVFGYIGTHIPAKGIQDLIEAFGKVNGKAKLLIWGRPQGYNTHALKKIAETLPKEKQDNIIWKHEYNNENIMSDVFQHIDCLVVPSIWVENSPLVIHEALQARVLVITANAGGMAEYVEHKVNGLLFEHRNNNSLIEMMQLAIDDPDLTQNLSQRGYLNSANGDIPNLEEHVTKIERIYYEILNNTQETSDETRSLAYHV